MVSHSWTYQALVNDVLGMRLNRVAVEVSGASSMGGRFPYPASQVAEMGKLAKKSYDLDAKDFFWAKNAANPFPQVAEEIDVELTKYVLPRLSRELDTDPSS